MMKELVRGSFVPPKRIQQLRANMDRRSCDLDDEIVRKLAKLGAVVQRCNIRLSNYVSNTDSKGYKSVINKICEDEGVTDPKYQPNIDKMSQIRATATPRQMLLLQKSSL